MKLEIEKDRVLEAAEQCGDAKKILKTLFPKAFQEEITFKFGDRLGIKTKGSEQWGVYILTWIFYPGSIYSTKYKITLVNLETGKALIEPVNYEEILTTVDWPESTAFSTMEIPLEDFKRLFGKPYEEIDIVKLPKLRPMSNNINKSLEYRDPKVIKVNF